MPRKPATNQIEDLNADLARQIRENLVLYRTDVEMPGGWIHNLPKTLQRIELYYNSQYLTGNKDADGSYKYFYNIVKPACDVAAKFIDLDTKDFILVTEKTGIDHKLWFMQRELRYWMKKTGFARQINDATDSVPKFGHLVFKRTAKNTREPVVIHNLRMDPSAPSLEKSAFVYELHTMSRWDLEEMNKTWQSQTVTDFLAKEKENTFIVYECQHRDGTGWKRAFVTDVLAVKDRRGRKIRTAESSINDKVDYQPMTVLYEDRVEDFLYLEEKWEVVPGRYLGLGFVEYLFDNQIAKNENANLRKKAMYIESLHLFQTSDEAFANRNLATTVQNGQVLVSKDPINPLATEARNLASHGYDDSSWDRNSEQKTFSFDIARGDKMPANTPLGVAQLSAGMVESYFDKKKENLGLFFRQMILEDILPSFKKERRKSHILKFFGTDKEIGKVRAAFESHLMRRGVLNYAAKYGVIPSQKLIDLERTRIRLSLKRKKDLDVQMPEGFYDDVDADVDVVVTGEQVDSGSRQQTFNAILSIMGQNPGVLENPTTRAVLFKMLELAGVSPVEIDLLEEKVATEPATATQEEAAAAQPEAMMAAMAQQAQPQAQPQPV